MMYAKRVRALLPWMGEVVHRLVKGNLGQGKSQRRNYAAHLTIRGCLGGRESGRWGMPY
ncbi:hypothetical protein TJA_25120 [Thermus sp. LT1-2-5]